MRLLFALPLVIASGYLIAELLVMRARRKSFENHIRETFTMLDVPAEDRDDWGTR